MTFWHIQLHKDLKSRFSLAQFREILQEKKVIGLGHPWRNKRGEFVPDSARFQNEMEIGDIVMVRDGKTPIALVKVISDAYEEVKPDAKLDWFPVRRRIEVLEFYVDRPELKDLLQRILLEGNRKHIQATGTLTKGSDLTKVTNRFIQLWWEGV